MSFLVPLSSAANAPRISPPAELQFKVISLASGRTTWLTYLEEKRNPGSILTQFGNETEVAPLDIDKKFSFATFN